MGSMISAKNWLDDPATTIALFGGGTILRPLAELKMPFGAGLARVSNSAFVGLDIDLGSARKIVTVGALGFSTHVISATVFLGTTQGANNVASSVGINYSADWGYPLNTAAWMHAPSSAAWEARWVRILLYGDTVFDIRRLWIGAGMITSRAADREPLVLPVDRSTVERLPRGGVHRDPSGQWKRLTCGFSNRPDSEILGLGYDPAPGGIMGEVLRAGLSNEIVVAPRLYNTELPNGDHHRYRYWMTTYGQVAEMPQVAHHNAGRSSIPTLTIEEAPMPALS